jgi:hypothetical protein
MLSPAFYYEFLLSFKTTLRALDLDEHQFKRHRLAQGC